MVPTDMFAVKMVENTQSGYWVFTLGGSKLVRSVAKTEHTTRKLLNFIMRSHQKLGINLEGKMPENGSY